MMQIHSPGCLLDLSVQSTRRDARRFANFSVSRVPHSPRLTRVDRARVAEELLSSLEESDEEVATAWATELERRSREVAEGRVQTTSWETARAEILKELEQRRAPRTAP
jgi:putative addiction module component (TIGR02574 family)